MWPGEHDALSRVDKLSKVVTGINREIAVVNKKILREKAKRDGLVARKQQISGRLRTLLDLIDTAKNRLETP